MELKDYEISLLALIESMPTVYLSTIDAEGYPVTRAMLNLRNKTLYPHLSELYEEEKNPFVIYLTTNTTSVKMKEIADCNKVSLYFCNDEKYLGILLRGKIEIIIEKKIKQKIWVPGWETYYPKGINSKDFSVLRFIPNKIKSYGDLNKEEEDSI